MIYAGLDLHKSFSVITVMDAQERKMIKQKKLGRKLSRSYWALANCGR